MHTKSRLVQIVRNPRSVGAVVLALISVSTQMVALAAASGWSPAVTDTRATMAAAIIRSLACASSSTAKAVTCPVAVAPKLAGDNTHEHVVVPSGSAQCPNSGAGAACASRTAPADLGNSAVPVGLPACPVDAAKAAVTAPGSCLAQPAAPAPVAPTTTPTSPATSPATAPQTPDAVQPTSPETLSLTASSTFVSSGAAILLDARSSLDVGGTPFAIEIFDTSTGALVAACTQTAECKVSFSAKSGAHRFMAYVIGPTSTVPSGGARLTSNPASVHFLGVNLAVKGPAVVAPGKPMTFVANATEDMGGTGFVIELHDATNNGSRLTYCSRGTACSMSLVEPNGGVHRIIATLGPSSPEVLQANPDVNSHSEYVAGTWLSVEINATSRAGAVSLTALANADLSQTPYSIYMFDQAGKPVGDPCHAGICSASTPEAAGDSRSFVAVVAQLQVQAGSRGPITSVMQRAPVGLNRLDIQVASVPVKAVRTMWGVDSCKRITDDPAGSNGLLPQVNRILGPPDFWGRYLPNTANCPGLNGAEIAAAHNQHFAILPIYNDYDCSAVSGYQAGSTYAAQAIVWLRNDLIPPGTGIAIDIEPPGDWCPGAANVDTGFIQGWYDGITAGGYAPAYYGNTSPGSEFANAWCATTRARPEIATNSYLWSFEPSLSGNFSKRTAPAFGSYSTGCPGHYMTWQYVLSAGGTPDVDQDEASSSFPFWYP